MSVPGHRTPAVPGAARSPRSRLRITPDMAHAPTLATERYQRAALDAIPEAWLFLRSVRDGAGRVVDFAVIDLNAAAERLAGRPRGLVIGSALGTYFPLHRQLGLHDTYVAVAERGASLDEERCVYAEGDEELWVHVRAVPIPGGLAVFTRDVGERRRAQSARARLVAILEEMPDVVTVNDTDGRITYLNGAARALLGLPAERPADDRYHLSLADVQPQRLAGGALEEATRVAARDGTWRGETVLRKRDGREVPVEQVLIAHAGADGRPTFFSSVMRDITDRKQVEATLRSLSLVDELTGLYNRRGFLTVAGQALDRARERGAPALVFYMDMDDFKRINDCHGHAVGDVALRVVADVLRSTFRESDVIGRIGGDEFVAFAVHGVGMDPDAIARTVVARIEQRLAAVNGAAGREYALRLSVGTANDARPRGAAASALDALLASADAALYEEKCRRKGRA
jgi:diguanylate cyclase (GGDEF)-like protein/PAS domain S-box-containing protein